MTTVLPRGDQAGPDRCLHLASPVGILKLVVSDAGLRAVSWPDDRPGRIVLGETVEDPDDPLLIEAAKQLTAYFAGGLTRFDLPLDFRGTDFQRCVWAELLTIPFGATCSYAAIARRIGRTSAVRAVGAANGRNPIAIVAPCHRVVGGDGALTGFAGGMAAKRLLLDLESPRLL